MKPLESGANPAGAGDDVIDSLDDLVEEIGELQREQASLSHLDSQGHLSMVDVSAKPETARAAVARGRVRMKPETAALIGAGAVAKGSVLTVARVAGVLAAKKCSDLIPLAHPLPLTDIQVDLELLNDSVEIEARVSTTWKTGVEMEALTAVTVAALTVYDMCKAADREMVIDSIRVTHKSGGKHFLDGDPVQGEAGRSGQ